MSSEIVYNSVNWKTSYSFTLSENGFLGGDDLPPARNDGYIWIPGSNEPATETVNYGIQQIIVNGVIKKTTNTGLLGACVSLKEAMRILKQANIFKTLYCSDNTDIEWLALPNTVTITYFGPRSTALSARVTVVFDSLPAYSDVP